MQYNLGAPGAASKKDRKHGICCGITVAWIVGVCHDRDDAVNTTNFENYFRNVLRFQGAYLKDHKGNVGAIDDLDGIHPQGLTKAGSGKCSSAEFRPVTQQRILGGVSGLYHHAVGVGAHGMGIRGSRYLIMDPNGGLFKYKNKSDFITDVQDLCDARREAKNGGANFAFTTFKKA